MLKPSDPTRVYLTLSSVLSFAFTLAFTLQGLYFVTVAGLNPLQLLLIGAALEGAAFLLEVPTGVVADVYSRRRSVILGCLCLGVAMALVAAFPMFWALVLTQVVSAAGYTFLSGAQQAWLADEVGENRAAHLYLLGSQYGRAAGIAGIGATALLAPLGLAVPILVGSAVTLLLALYLWLRMPEDGFSPAPQVERDTWAMLSGTFRQGLKEVQASRVLTLLMLTALLYGASSEALDRLNEFLLVREVGLPGGLSATNWFILLTLAAQVIGLGVTEPLRRRTNPADVRAAAATLRWVLGAGPERGGTPGVRVRSGLRLGRAGPGDSRGPARAVFAAVRRLDQPWPRSGVAGHGEFHRVAGGRFGPGDVRPDLRGARKHAGRPDRAGSGRAGTGPHVDAAGQNSGRGTRGIDLNTIDLNT